MNTNNDNLLIEYEKVTQTATNINDCANQMNRILNNFTDRMNELKRREIIVGNAADTLEETFLRLKQNFDSYIKTVQEFSKMISYAGNTTRQTEEIIRKDAENLPK